MKKLAIGMAAAAMALTGASANAGTLADKGEAHLAKLIEGRVAGEPVSCISAPMEHRLKVIDYVGLVYEDGDTVYVSRVANPNSLSFSDVPVIERWGSQLCKHDVKRTMDSSTGQVTGIVFLGDFVPYTKQG